MANHGMTNAQAAQIGAKTLWIGDIEPWMDENYVQGLFNGVSVLTFSKVLDCCNSLSKTN